MPRRSLLALGRALWAALLVCGVSCAGTIPPSQPGEQGRAAQVQNSDLLLMQHAYEEVRLSATDTVLAVLADEMAAEAAVQGLAGATDEAVMLWMEAILLLESARGDTTLEVTSDQGR